MNDKEYTYDIDKYTIGVDENGEDGIGMTVAKIENGEINFLGNCYGENARCIDLLIKENQELKKHLKVPENCSLKTLEDYKSYYEDTTREQILEDSYIEYCAYVNLAHRYSELKKKLEDKTEDYRRMKDNFDSKVDVLTEIDTQQKKFIKYLEDEIKSSMTLDTTNKQTAMYIYSTTLKKYKEIIGDNN